jgi:hypothetical protein
VYAVAQGIQELLTNYTQVILSLEKEALLSAVTLREVRVEFPYLLSKLDIVLFIWARHPFLSNFTVVSTGV